MTMIFFWNRLSKKRKGLYAGCLGGLVLLLVLSYNVYQWVWSPNFFPERIAYVYVDESTTFDGVCEQLEREAGVRRMGGFRRLAGMLGYPGHLRTGRYAIHDGASNLTVLNDLRRGHQSPVRVTFNNIRLKEDLAARLDEQLMLKTDALLSLWGDSLYCDSLGFTPTTILTLFIPNTYEFYWNVSAGKFMSRMKREYDNFWNEKRQEKAKEIGLTPIEISILASIVEEESAIADEYPLIAGLYLNRLRAGVPLQADPTVKYALGDFGLRRILFEHLEVDSPYNTYKYVGLPPGPLRIPTIRGIDAVLNYTKHRYMYMCAKEDFSGRHNFAVTLAEHNRNANRYRAELNRRKIH